MQIMDDGIHVPSSGTPSQPLYGPPTMPHYAPIYVPKAHVADSHYRYALPP